jgi:hypothetical protein
MEDTYTEYLLLYIHSKQEYKQTLRSTTATEFKPTPLFVQPNHEFVPDGPWPQITNTEIPKR